MATTDERAIVAAAALDPPRCLFPRPGDSVVWYEGGVLRHGELLGSTYDGRPYIKGSDGLTNPVPGFDRIRLDDPRHPVEPMWQALPSGGLICKPTASERASMRRLADQTVPGGATPRKLADEIWLRGFEVFMAGPQVRLNLAGSHGKGAELVTAMPPDRLRQMIVDMYGEAHSDARGDARGGARIDAGELSARAGRVRVGGQPGTSDPFTTVRGFRSNRPGTLISVYGASFAEDMRYGDFACNAVYYDLRNEVFIDPSGHGLEDAAASCLRPVLDENDQTPQTLAYVGLNVLAQYLLRFKLHAGSESKLLGFLADGLATLDSTQRIAALQAVVIDHVRSDAAGRGYGAKEIVDRMRGFFTEFGREDLWDQYVFPCLGELDLGGSAA